jgi:hypothetical protein
MISRSPLAPHGVIEVLLKRLLPLVYCSASRGPAFTLFTTGVLAWLLLPRRAT